MGKHLGAANADTCDVKVECRRHLNNVFTYKILTKEQMIEFVRNVKSIVEIIYIKELVLVMKQTSCCQISMSSKYHIFTLSGKSCKIP